MDILDRFILQAKENVKTNYYGLPKKAFPKKKFSLKKKLLENDFSLIAEIKHASPAGEYSFDFIDAKKTAKEFQDAGADAVSCVVEPAIFLGKLSNVNDAKSSCSLPVLFKDFVLEKKQLDAARAFGADCVLLIVKVFDRLGLDLDDFISYAHSLGLEVLLECYDKKEAQKAMQTNADFFGINNRDLRTLKVDLIATKEVIKEFNASDNRPVISESGILTRKDAEFVISCGTKGVLVGTAIWKSENRNETIRQLKGAI